VRFVVCHTCRQTVQVGGPPEEVAHLIQDQKNFPCITPLCGGRMEECRALDLPPDYERREIPIQGFFRAIHGFGSGEGAPASFQRARDLLLTQKIVELVGEPVGQPERVIIRQLVLDNGTKLHFEASARGACLYYIEERGPSCREVVEHELSLSPNPASGDSNREEAGRALERRPEASSGGQPNADSAGTRLAEHDVSPVCPAGEVHAGAPERSRESQGHDGGHREAVRV